MTLPLGNIIGKWHICLLTSQLAILFWVRWIIGNPAVPDYTIKTEHE